MTVKAVGVRGEAEETQGPKGHRGRGERPGKTWNETGEAIRRVQRCPSGGRIIGLPEHASVMHIVSYWPLMGLARAC